MIFPTTLSMFRWRHSWCSLLVQWATGTTAYRHSTYAETLLYAAYGMLGFVVTQTLRKSSQFQWLAKAVTVYGGAVAAFAVLQGIAPNGKLYWLWPSAQGGAIYGPYVNHNHYAGLMEMLTPFPLVLAASRFTEGTPQDRHDRNRRAHGGKHFSLRLARWNAGLLRANGCARRSSAALARKVTGRSRSCWDASWS